MNHHSPLSLLPPAGILSRQACCIVLNVVGLITSIVSMREAAKRCTWQCAARSLSPGPPSWDRPLALCCMLYILLPSARHFHCVVLRVGAQSPLRQSDSKSEHTLRCPHIRPRAFPFSSFLRHMHPHRCTHQPPLPRTTTPCRGTYHCFHLSVLLTTFQIHMPYTHTALWLLHRFPSPHLPRYRRRGFLCWYAVLLDCWQCWVHE